MPAGRSPGGRPQPPPPNRASGSSARATRGETVPSRARTHRPQAASPPPAPSSSRCQHSRGVDQAGPPPGPHRQPANRVCRIGPVSDHRGKHRGRLTDMPGSELNSCTSAEESLTVVSRAGPDPPSGVIAASSVAVQLRPHSQDNCGMPRRARSRPACKAPNRQASCSLQQARPDPRRGWRPC